jgi:hypothetical protein
VVVLTVHRRRGDALLLTAGGITSLELPLLTQDAVAETAEVFREAQRAAGSGGPAAVRRQAEATLGDVLAWLWDAVAGPVLDALGLDRRPPEGAAWPRMWWAPGGLLGLLPLHAAGHHTDPADRPDRRTVLDRVVSSYTPTVRALRHARERARRAPAAAPPRGLIVAMPTTPGLPGRLDGVPGEAAAARARLGDTVLLREPGPDDPPPPPSGLPTSGNVLAHLPHCAIAHFACHGTSHPADPSQSRLLLHDHAESPLTVARLAPLALDRARLAYLSACRTAVTDSAPLRDEAIHLASAFQVIGFPHVVGTLWEVNDRLAATVADLFYAALHTPGGALDTDRAAHALHHAVRAVRDGRDAPGSPDRVRTPSLWAPYIHSGA